MFNSVKDSKLLKVIYLASTSVSLVRLKLAALKVAINQSIPFQLVFLFYPSHQSHATSTLNATWGECASPLRSLQFFLFAFKSWPILKY